VKVPGAHGEARSASSYAVPTASAHPRSSHRSPLEVWPYTCHSWPAAIKNGTNPRDNPYWAARGSEPPELAGRGSELGAADTALAMGRGGQPAKPIVYTGLRGMGKTALLRTVERRAKALDGVVLFAEADASLSFGETLQRSLRRATDRTASLPKRVAAALRRIEQRLPKISYELPAGTVRSRSPPQTPTRSPSAARAMPSRICSSRSRSSSSITIGSSC